MIDHNEVQSKLAHIQGKHTLTHRFPVIAVR